MRNSLNSYLRRGPAFGPPGSTTDANVEVRRVLSLHLAGVKPDVDTERFVLAAASA